MKRKNLAHIFTGMFTICLLLGAILMTGGNYLGDLIVISSGIGATTSLALS